MGTGIYLPGSLVSGISNEELDALENLVRAGVPLAEAMRRLGLLTKISEKTAARLLRSRGVQVASRLLTGLFGLSTGFWIALGVGAVVLIGGGYYWANYMGDQPVRPGSRITDSGKASQPGLSFPRGQASQPDHDPYAADVSGQGSAPGPSIPGTGQPPEPSPVDLSGRWTLTWNWSVTSVDFVGSVTGGPNQWSFEGTLEGGGNAIWTPAKGSA